MELQAIAAARSKASQDKLNRERKEREAAEREKKLASEARDREKAQREREMIIVREERRKQEEKARKQAEMERKKQLEKRMMMQEEMKRKEKAGLDIAKFRSASNKAIKIAGGSLKKKKSNSNGRGRGHEDSMSPPPNMREYSTLTREEKRKKKEEAMLGLNTSTKRKHPMSFSPHNNGKNKEAVPIGDLVKLGTQKRDTRSVDEIERDLLAAKKKAQKELLGQGMNESRGEREVEQILRRKKAMEEKRFGGVREMRGYGGEDNNNEKKKRKIEVDDPLTLANSTTYPSKSKISFGINPADYLPGAPIRADMLPKVSPKLTSRSDSKDVKPGKEKSRHPKEMPGPPKKETPREKYIREEAEKKRKLAMPKSTRYDEDEDEDGDENSEDSELSEEDDYESEEEENLLDPKGQSFHDEIWKMFNRKDKSEYLARDVDSDDDMEADMESLAREEARSAKIARMEDQREEEALRRREREKAQRKATKSRS